MATKKRKLSLQEALFGDSLSLEEDSKENTASGKETAKVCSRFQRPALPSFQEFYEQISSRYKGQPQLPKILLVIYRYMECVSARKPFRAKRMLIAAPSSGGKTFLFEVIRKFLKEHRIYIPVIILDTTMYTETGFKGGEVSEMVDVILDEAFNSHAIVVLDEADKRLRPSYGAKEVNYNAAFQGCLLNLLGGGVCLGKTDGRELYSEETMFVLLGAFSDLRNDRREEEGWTSSNLTHFRRRCKIGFDSDNSGSEDGAEKREMSHFAPITREDIIRYGACEELVGRLHHVFNLQPLGEETVAELVGDYVEEVAKEYNVSVRITPNAVNEYVDISYGPTGLRYTRSEIMDAVNTAVSEHMISAPEKEVKEYLILGLNKIKTIPSRRRSKKKPDSQDGEQKER